MHEFKGITVLFVAGFGPVVRDATAGRKLYADTLGLRFKEEAGGYLHTETLQGAKSFALWPLSQAAQSCFGTDSWPDGIPVPQAWLESMSKTSRSRRKPSRPRAIGCSSRTRRNRGARLSVDSSIRKDS